MISKCSHTRVVNGGFKQFIWAGGGDDKVTLNKGNSHTVYTGEDSIDMNSLNGGAGQTVKLSAGFNMVNVSAINVAIDETSGTATEEILVNWSN